MAATDRSHFHWSTPRTGGQSTVWRKTLDFPAACDTDTSPWTSGRCVADAALEQASRTQHTDDPERPVRCYVVGRSHPDEGWLRRVPTFAILQMSARQSPDTSRRNRTPNFFVCGFVDSERPGTTGSTVERPAHAREHQEPRAGHDARRLSRRRERLDDERSQKLTLSIAAYIGNHLIRFGKRVAHEPRHIGHCPFRCQAFKNRTRRRTFARRPRRVATQCRDSGRSVRGRHRDPRYHSGTKGNPQNQANSKHDTHDFSVSSGGYDVTGEEHPKAPSRSGVAPTCLNTVPMLQCSWFVHFCKHFARSYVRSSPRPSQRGGAKRGVLRPAMHFGQLNSPGLAVTRSPQGGTSETLPSQGLILPVFRRWKTAMATHFVCCFAFFITLSIVTGAPSSRLLSSAASMKARISSVSSAETGGRPVLKNLQISTTNGT